jgi:hypothetical protein
VKDFFLNCLKSLNPLANEALTSTHHKDLSRVIILRYAVELMKLASLPSGTSEVEQDTIRTD